ncbi:DUF192 domain-containing protein [Pelagibius marinus]|uniref:DUF192 domain-containing protein n=1 Tax=Pelagibius marinus TaxID=2762760 RepID=UPI00187236A9|nr:DUF192 domain-containing protein [Pelagibius marinus]
MKRLLSLVILLAAMTLPGAALAQSGPLVAFGTGELNIETASGENHSFQVEIAETPDQRAQGLMFRRQMAAEAGMLFLFEGGSQERAMWMKNTLIPLDMLFIDEAGKIVRIEQRTVPHSLRAIRSGQPVAAVLELNAGTTSRLAIEPGDRVIHPAFN